MVSNISVDLVDFSKNTKKLMQLQQEITATVFLKISENQIKSTES